MSTKTRAHHHTGHASTAAMRERPAVKAVPVREKVSEEEQSRLIHVRAYGLWEQAGKPDGDAARERCWCEAEKEIMSSHAADE
jgi:hypothetical protein